MRVCVIGDFDVANVAHTELEPALIRAAPEGETLDVAWISPRLITEEGVLKHLSDADAILGPPGVVDDVGGFLDAVEFAREGEAPYLGIEAGMDLAVVEFAKTVLVMTRAHSHEYDDAKTDAVVTVLDPPPIAPGRRPVLLGELTVKFTKDGKLGSYYGKPTAVETHRSRYGVTPSVRNQLARAGLKTVATDETGFVVRALEHAEHPFFVLVAYVPHLGPAAAGVHPLLRAFLAAV